MSAVARLSCVLGLLLLPACGGREQAPGAEHEVGAPEPLRTLALARQLARGAPPLARALTHGALEPHGAAASSKAGATDPFVRLPQSADGVFELGPGQRAAPLARVRLVGASGAALELVEGVAIYRGAFGGEDSLWLEHANALEQLLLLRAFGPKVELSWELCRAPFLDAGRSSAELGWIFSDGHGTDRLRVPPSFALDARGVRRELTLGLEPAGGSCGRLTFTLSTAGLSAPLLVDPALEAVVWTDRTDPERKPPGRYGHGLAYDPVREKTVLFGGSVNGPPPFLGDTWEWDGSAWSDASPSEHPEGRFFHDLAYSSLHGGAVLIGGATGDEYSTAQNDVWVYDGTWTQLQPAGDTLPIVAGHGIAFDSARQELALYGGYGLDENRELWELGSAGWKDRGEFALSPGSIDSFAMVYDAAQKHTLVFGGVTPAGVSSDPFAPRTDGAYFWNGKGWTRIDSERPSPRSGMASGYDSKRGRVVLFGGTPAPDDSQFSDETWEYADGSFELRTALRSPPPRESARLSYDAARDRMVLFGGFGWSDGDDTWTYAHFGNSCHDSDDCDGEACVDGVCCQDQVCDTCEACSEQTGTCQPIEDGPDDNGSCSGDHSCHAGRCLLAGGESCRKDSECATGHCADGWCCDRACDGACESCALGSHEGVCQLVEGDAAHGSCPGKGECATSCDGKHAECDPIPEGRDCGSACQDGVLTSKTCDASGSCHSAAPEACAEHLVCQDERSCLERCSETDDCAAGFECHGGACVELSSRCADDSTVEGPGGREDCGAYRCASGKCRTSCQRASDCADGFVCNERGQCLAPEAVVSQSPADDDGCGCRAAGAGAARPGWLAAALALATLRRRRRLS